MLTFYRVSITHRAKKFLPNQSWKQPSLQTSNTTSLVGHLDIQPWPYRFNTLIIYSCYMIHPQVSMTRPACTTRVDPHPSTQNSKNDTPRPDPASQYFHHKSIIPFLSRPSHSTLNSFPEYLAPRQRVVEGGNRHAVAVPHNHDSTTGPTISPNLPVLSLEAFNTSQ